MHKCAAYLVMHDCCVEETPNLIVIDQLCHSELALYIHQMLRKMYTITYKMNVINHANAEVIKTVPIQNCNVLIIMSQTHPLSLF